MSSPTAPPAAADRPTARCGPACLWTLQEMLALCDCKTDEPNNLCSLPTVAKSKPAVRSTSPSPSHSPTEDFQAKQRTSAKRNGTTCTEMRNRSSTTKRERAPDLTTSTCPWPNGFSVTFQSALSSNASNHPHLLMLPTFLGLPTRVLTSLPSPASSVLRYQHTYYNSTNGTSSTAIFSYAPSTSSTGAFCNCLSSGQPL